MFKIKSPIIHVAPLSDFPPESLANAASDPNLSFAAKGVLFYILNRHEKGFVSVSEIENSSKSIKNNRSIKDLIDELRNKGYIVVSRFRENNNLEYRYDCYLVPKHNSSLKPS